MFSGLNGTFVSSTGRANSSGGFLFPDGLGSEHQRDRRFVVATLGDGTMRWYTFEKGEEVLALFVDRDLRRWVAWNPDGFFSFEAAAMR